MMTRVAVGVVAVRLLAPFIFALFVLLFAVTFIPDFHFDPELLRAVLFVGFGALIEDGYVLFPASAVIAYGLYRLEIRSPWPPILCGAALGPVLILLISPHALGSQWLAFFAILPGAVCGWIYWLIAIGRTPSNGHAIEAA